MPAVRVAVVGHVEWVEFLRVDAVPRPGEIVQAAERWEEPAGGGEAAERQARVARERQRERHHDESEQDPEARVHPSASPHARAAARAARYVSAIAAGARASSRAISIRP